MAAAVQARSELSELWGLVSADPSLVAQLSDPDLAETLFAPDNNAIKWVAPLAFDAGLHFGCIGGAAQSGACSLSMGHGHTPGGA